MNTLPSNVREVSHDEFFAELKAQPHDVMPTTEMPEITIWRRQDSVNREIWGYSTPGWRNPADPKTYGIVRR